jgi:zinc transporter ZupT
VVFALIFSSRGGFLLIIYSCLYENNSFAAGAMIYVVVEELIPEMSQGEHSNTGVVMFAFGFTVMMALDVALG